MSRYVILYGHLNNFATERHTILFEAETSQEAFIEGNKIANDLHLGRYSGFYDILHQETYERLEKIRKRIGVVN